MPPYRDMDDDEEDWEEEDADGDDSEDADEEPTVPCPFCKREILEDSPCCPHCQRSISDEDHSRTARPLWVVLTALICLGASLWWVFRSF